MQSPVVQIINEGKFEIKYASFILQTQLEPSTAIFNNSIRNLPTLFDGDPVLSIPPFAVSQTACAVDVKLQPSLIWKSTFTATPLNLKADIVSFGKVSAINPMGIQIDGQTVNVSLLGKRDIFTVSNTPSVIDFTNSFGYFMSDPAFNSTTFPSAVGNVHRYQVIVDVTIRSKWPI